MAKGEPDQYNFMVDRVTYDDILIGQMAAMPVDLIANYLAPLDDPEIGLKLSLTPFEILEQLRRFQGWGLAAYDSEARGWYSPLLCSECLYEFWGGQRRASTMPGSGREREAIPPRVRFGVLQRDGFRCTYCGRTAAAGAVLQVDHVIPVAAGGTNDPDNLVAAYVDCNQGKSDRDIL